MNGRQLEGRAEEVSAPDQLGFEIGVLDVGNRYV